MITRSGTHKILLIDVMSEAFRAFHSVPKTIFSEDGKLINALIGFNHCLRKLFADFAPSYCAAAWSCTGPTFRHTLFPAYKSHRSTPQPLVEQKQLLANYLKWLRIPQFSSEGFEADDILATLAAYFASRGYYVLVDTVDKDLCAISSVAVHIWISRTKSLLTPQEVIEKFEVPPERIPDLLALLGDKTDGVPRLSEFSQREAVAMINTYGSLDAILNEHLAELSPVQKEKIQRNRSLIERNLQLTRLRTDVPLSILPDLPGMDHLRQAIALATENLKVKDVRFLDSDIRVTPPKQGQLW